MRRGKRTEMLEIFGRKFRLLRLMKSKKNRVCLVENSGQLYILKLYRAPHHLRASLEHRVLRKTFREGPAVPQPLAFVDKKALLMKYIPGENLCDLLNRRCLPEYADKLARWFSAFHRCFEGPGGKTLLRGDSNLRNFIIRADGALCGVDFEEAAPGDPARDIGQICASILDTEPMFTPVKAALCRRLIHYYGNFTGRANLEQHLLPEIAAALRETSRRRPQQRTYLSKQAKLLEQQGLTRYL
ncbi:MAG: phosphotransferase [Firmicutes bacterium]|nr:phosphotransferase [Bacillota bacterium]